MKINFLTKVPNVIDSLQKGKENCQTERKKMKKVPKIAIMNVVTKYLVDKIAQCRLTMSRENLLAECSISELREQIIQLLRRDLFCSVLF